jgi:hypothetical protein
METGLLALSTPFMTRRGLTVSDEPAKRLAGQYWTDRRTAGEICLTDQQKKKIQTFESARAYYMQNVS